MSRKAAALNKALGTGLGLLSESMYLENQRARDFAAQSALDSAEARRRESLERMKRDWQREDAALAHDRSLEAIRARSEAEIEAAATKRQNEIENPTPYEQARVESEEALQASRGASAEAARARAGLLETQTEDLQRKMDLGMPADATAYEKNLPHRFKMQTLQFANNQTAGYFRYDTTESPSVDTFIARNPEDAKALGITEKTPLREAFQKVRDSIYHQQIQQMGPEFNVQRLQPQAGPPQQSGNEGLLGEVINQVQPTVAARGNTRSAGAGAGQNAAVPPVGTMPGAGRQGQGQGQPGTSAANPIPADQLTGTPPDGTYVRDRQGTIWLIRGGRKVRVSG